MQMVGSGMCQGPERRAGSVTPRLPGQGHCPPVQVGRPSRRQPDAVNILGFSSRRSQGCGDLPSDVGVFNR